MAKIHVPGISIRAKPAAESNFNSVVYDGLVIPPDSILFYESGQHEGPDGSTPLVDTSLTLVSNSRVGFKLRNTSDGSEGIITFNSPNNVTAPMLGGTDNLWDIGDYYEIVINIDNPDVIEYEDTTNLGGTVTMNAKGVPVITGSSGTHTFDFRIFDDSDQTLSDLVTATVVVV
jgi:hypothetical protein